MARWIVIIVLVLTGISIYVAQRRERVADNAAAAHAPLRTLASGCAPPAALALGDGAVQSDGTGAMPPVRLADATVQPLAGFSVDARVLSAERYRSDRESRYAPIDLALGWGKMRDDAVLSALEIGQSGRWYMYRWSQPEPPIPVQDIIRSSANMHMIPSTPAVASALEEIEQGDHVRIDGWLVQVQADDGWRWRSSLSREDSGAGGCELVYVCAVYKR